MASIRKRGRGYQITVSNGRDIHDKQILETTTWIPDPDKTEKQNQFQGNTFSKGLVYSKHFPYLKNSLRTAGKVRYVSAG